MKKTFVILMTILVCFAVQKPLSCYAHDRGLIHLEYSDAPDGTAYIDLLAKFSDDDAAYTEFNISPYCSADSKWYGSLSVDENSEIAKYCEDGYASLTIHSKNIAYFTIHKERYGLEAMSIKGSVDEFYSKYKKFKLAYVGENGEVLNVTSATRKGLSSSHKPDTFAANGEKAVFRSIISDYISKYIWIIIPVIIFLVIVISVFLLRKIANKKKI